MKKLKLMLLFLVTSVIMVWAVPRNESFPVATNDVQTETSYYMFNLGTSMYIGIDYDWAARVAVIKNAFQQVQILDASAEGFYHMRSVAGFVKNGNNMYIFRDTDSGWGDWQNPGEELPVKDSYWTIIRQGEGPVYKIKNRSAADNTYLGPISESDRKTATNLAADNENSKWLFIPVSANIELFHAKEALLFSKLNEVESIAGFPTDLIDGAKAVYANPSATLIEVKAALATLIAEQYDFEAAAVESPVNCTALIVNPTIEQTILDNVGRPFGWENSFNAEGPNSFITKDNGRNTVLEAFGYHYNANSKFDYSQTITGLPNGLYKLSAKCLIEVETEEVIPNENVGLYAQSKEQDYFTNVSTLGEHTYTTDFVRVENNSLKIGVRKNGLMNVKYFTADDFELAYYGELPATSKEQTIYIDFGKNDVENGNITLSPDVNDNYWNNALETAFGSKLNLVNSANENTDYVLEITKNFSANGIKNGGLLSPDVALLGDLAIPTATQDYFYIDGYVGNYGAFKIKQLDRAKAYKFYIFGSRSDDENNRVGYISLSGATGTNDTYTMGGPGVGAGGVNTNNNTIFESDYIFPDHKGEILFQMAVKEGGFSHINVMKIEEHTDIDRVNVGQKFYIDLGRNNGDDGHKMQGPDANNNYWNAFSEDYRNAPADIKLTLVNSSNILTAVEMEMTTAFQSNGIRNGALTEPDPALLGDLAVKYATEDYFFIDNTMPNLGTINFKNLDATKMYRFYIFGSRAENENRIGLYTLTGTNSTTGVHRMSGTGVGGEGINGNNSDVFVSELIYPDAEGIIKLDVVRYASNFSYINVIKIEECDNDVYTKVTSIEIDENAIDAPGQCVQMAATTQPDGAFYYYIAWSVDDATIARITPEGLLCPLKNGTVNVTATTAYGDEIITATKAISVTNQYTELYFGGSASENGEGISNVIPMKRLSSGLFEIYTSLAASGSFNFYTSTNELEAITYGMDDTEGELLKEGAPITTATSGTVRITVNFPENTYTIMPVTQWNVTGNVTPEGGISLDYQGDGVWSKTVNFTQPSGTPYFMFEANADNNYRMKRIKGTFDSVGLEAYASMGDYTVEDMSINAGTYVVTLNLANYTYSINCSSIGDLKISFMGSSVPSGTGAADNKGYAHMYSDLLVKRHNDESGLNWEVSNISIGGNSTVDLLNRWEKDLISNCAQYVVYALSLGNEGIHDFGQERFDRFRDNMLDLIAQARAVGKIPVVTNNYTRGDFNATDYDFVKEMNLLMHEWDVPSVNLLGAIDDGNGRWADGYQDGGDIFHPNTQGHQELFYAMVPSLFDALEAGKTLPQRVTGTSYSLGASTYKYIEFTPEHIVHPFTLSFDVKTSGSGVIASFENGDATGSLKINESGELVYESPITGNITSVSASVNDNNWKKITLTHYHARGITMLYVNDTKIGELPEKLVPESFTFGKDAPEAIDYRELFFWRSGMNSEEIAALNAGKMLKSSLEIYAPLDGEEPLTNLAQSTNTLKLTTQNPPVSLPDNAQDEISVYPNPVSDKLHVKSDGSDILNISVIDSKGLQVKNVQKNSTVLDVSNLSQGVYFIKIKTKDNTCIKKIIKQ